MESKTHFILHCVCSKVTCDHIPVEKQQLVCYLPCMYLGRCAFIRKQYNNLLILLIVLAICLLLTSVLDQHLLSCCGVCPELVEQLLKMAFPFYAGRGYTSRKQYTSWLVIINIFKLGKNRVYYKPQRKFSTQNTNTLDIHRITCTSKM